MKKILLITLVLATILLAACGNNQPSGPVFDPYVGGSEGLSLEFLPGMPPVEEGAILDNQKSSFGIGIRIQNVGEHDYDPATELLYARVRGIFPGNFGVQPADLEQQITDPLRGARKNIDGTTLEGQFTSVTFNDLSYQNDAQGDVVQSFVVDICYDYRTKSTTPVCIANDVTDALTSENAQDICVISGPKGPKNSAGPVQITDFKQQPQGGSKVSIIFTVSHVGDGKIYKYQGNAQYPCDDSISNIGERDEVDLEITLPSTANAEIECLGSFTNSGNTATGSIKLYQGNPHKVTCTIDEQTPLSQEVVYEELLQVDMSYRYAEKLTKQVIIKDAGQ